MSVSEYHSCVCVCVPLYVGFFWIVLMSVNDKTNHICARVYPRVEDKLIEVVYCLNLIDS